jgi:hypothetical protein
MATCLHEPGDEECLVGVIGEDRPHCVKCRHCGQMVPWEQYDEADKFWYRKRRHEKQDSGVAGSTPAHLQREEMVAQRESTEEPGQGSHEVTPMALRETVASLTLTIGVTWPLQVGQFLTQSKK